MPKGGGRAPPPIQSLYPSLPRPVHAGRGFFCGAGRPAYLTSASSSVASAPAQSKPPVTRQISLPSAP